MRRLLLITAVAAGITTPAMAADLPTLKAPPAPSAFAWTGFYIGLEGGYEWAHETGLFADSALKGLSPYSINGGGGLLGGHIGYNYEVANIVFGIEADGGATVGFTGSTATVYNSLGVNGNPVGTNPYPIHLNQDWTADLRGRVGYAFDRVLPYIAGGLAFGNVSTTYFTPLNTPPSGPYLRVTTQRVGWTVGAGVEYAITDAISGRIEYRYTDLGTRSFTSLPAPLGHDTYDNVSFQSHAVLVGLSYKFGTPAPVVASY